MNDIAKQNVQEKLEKALTKEVLTVKRGAELLGITATQVSCIKNPKLWRNVGDIHWGSVLAWVNSGQTLVEWSEKHGKVLSEKKGTVPTETAKEAVERRARAMDEEIAKSQTVPRVTVKPEVLARRQEELAERKSTPRKGTNHLIDLLVEARKSLQDKIDTINKTIKILHSISHGD